MKGASHQKQKKISQYHLDCDGMFIIEDYNHSKSFSNFFPGVAGLWGIPMWVFYVNRGQCVTSFGIESKDKAILEFQPANKAYRITSTQGFRTFLKVKHGSSSPKFYEPFLNNIISPYKIRQRMMITAHDLTLEEINATLGLNVQINYFTLPEEPYAALVRRVKIENTAPTPCAIELIDGLPAIVPFGIKDWLNKNLSRTVEAWVKVRNLNAKAPFYQLNVEVSDTPQVSHIVEGNFYFSFDPERRGKDKLLDPIVKSGSVFGYASDFIVPELFLRNKTFTIPKEQLTSNRTPCAMSHDQFTLQSGSAKKIISLTGHAHDVALLNKIVHQTTQAGFIEHKSKRNRALISEIKNMCFTNSASMAFNHYCGQTFVDNVLRGGLPVSLATSEGAVAFNVYSRKHGDLERDYNFFSLAPTYLSQGNGNYRDVNQNRRNDIWFNSDVKDNSIINFYSLIQADGYNPLIVRGMTFAIDDPKVSDQIVSQFIKGEHCEKIKLLLKNGFMPGDLLKAVSNHGIKLKISPKEFLTRVLGYCHKNELADHGEGFWIDHWAYNLDLVESYLSIYPEHVREIFIEKKVFSFYLNFAFVQPRDERYVLTKNGVRQYHCVEENEKEIAAKHKGYQLRVGAGKGAVYHTTLLGKMLCVIANKAATLDPSGIGIEMEANKPSWYDALNGLPGLLGSSICETFELKRHADYILEVLKNLSLSDEHSVLIFYELADFISGLTVVLANEHNPVSYWKRSNELKENYRKAVRLGINGQEKKVSVESMKKFLQLVVDRTQKAIEQAKNKNGLFPTYFYHEVTQYELIDPNDRSESPRVRPLAFKRHDLPLFLEGFVHALRVENNSERALQIYAQVKKSKLFDQKLKMYKVNVDLSGQSEEIGRTRIFPPGWLENESIWLHMEYKYLLEVLRCGLNEQFFADVEHAFIPFLNSEIYGRNILENSSFIVSSVHEDPSLHGRGFVARLSGSTAELVHMWLVMNVGSKPFTLNPDGQLNLTFNPTLPAKFFTTQETTVDYFKKDGTWSHLKLPANSYAFNFLGSTLVVYHNPRRKNTFGRNGASVGKIILHYPNRKHPVELSSAITGSYAEDVRNHDVERIDIFL